MIKKLFLVLTLLFTFSCEDTIVEDEFPMKLWLNGEEIDVETEYQRITTFAEQLEYYNDSDSTTYTKKILVIQSIHIGSINIKVSGSFPSSSCSCHADAL